MLKRNSFNEPIDFKRFLTGTLFRFGNLNPSRSDTRKAPEDMKRLHLDYAAWLETWNCWDGAVDTPVIHEALSGNAPGAPLEETLPQLQDGNPIYRSASHACFLC